VADIERATVRFSLKLDRPLVEDEEQRLRLAKDTIERVVVEAVDSGHPLEMGAVDFCSPPDLGGFEVVLIVFHLVLAVEVYRNHQELRRITSDMRQMISKEVRAQLAQHGVGSYVENKEFPDEESESGRSQSDEAEK
jgi:hypothetical protein